MASRIRLQPGQVWLGPGIRPSRRIVACDERTVVYCYGGDRLLMCKRESFLRWRSRPYDERHGKKGSML